MSHAWYQTTRWRHERALFLSAHPLCAMHLEIGQTQAASVVDHVIPHRGDERLFWDQSNWQPLCSPCHNRHKKRAEHGRATLAFTAEGEPLGKQHHWNQG